MMLDFDFIRAQFPVFETEAGKDWAFFENAGGSYACRPVIDRLSRFYRERKMQPYWPARPSELGGEEMDEARARMSAWMGIDADELSFGPSTTQNTYVLSQAFRQILAEGDTIIVTNQDHEANSGPWRRLADAGIEVREWGLDKDSGRLDPEDLKYLLDEKVRLVCFPHCSNIIADINPVQDIVGIVKDVGAYTCVDGVSYAPHGIPNINDIGADIYLFSTYKTYGPHQGIMSIRRDLGERLPNQGHHFNAGSLYKRFTPAGPDHAQIAACAGIIDYFESLHDHHFEVNRPLADKGRAVHGLLKSSEESLMEPLLEYIKSKNSLRLLGPKEAKDRAPTLALKTQIAPQEIAERLADRKIAAGGDNFYGQRPIEAMGLDADIGVLRLSFVHYTTEQDIARLIDAIDDIL